MRDELPSLTINWPFLSKKIPSIRSRYWIWLKENVYSKFESGAGVLETIAPAPAKDPAVVSRDAILRKPGIIASLSTLGLKSITFLSSKFPWTDELKDGISSSGTPASCK